MHISSLVKIPWYLLELLSWNKNTDVLWAENSVKNGQNLPNSNPLPDIRNSYAHTKLGENPLIFTQVTIW